MNSITLKDGTFIYDRKGAIDYLTSLGFEKSQIDELQTLLFEGEASGPYEQGRRDQWEEDERIIDGYFCTARDLAQGVEDICHMYRERYKAKAVHNVLDDINKFVQENRID